MPSGGIVERIDVFRDPGASDRAILVDPFFYVLLLQTAEERFRNGIVPTISSTAHAQDQSIRSTEALPIVASVLRPLIRVDDDLLRTAPPNCHQNGVKHKASADGRCDCPTNDLSREQIQDHRQVQPAFPGPYIGNVGNPSLVWLADVELTLQNIWNELRRLGAGLRLSTIFSHGSYLVSAH